MEYMQDILNQEEGVISGKNLISENPPLRFIEPPTLKYYTDSAQDYIDHNQRFLKGKETSPWFKFVYISLPTSCNLQCQGCFTGKDKSRLPWELDGPFYSDRKITEVLSFLKKHNTKAVAYPGGGELFSWNGAFDYIERVTSEGLGMIIFSNGTLLSQQNLEVISSKDISLILSFRDTYERGHDSKTKTKGSFRKTLRSLINAIDLGMADLGKLAAEIPVTKDNSERVLYDFIPAMRHLGVVPLAEMFITTLASDTEKQEALGFNEVNTFFEQAQEIDAKIGYKYTLQNGTRMLSQPKCERVKYSFIIFPSGAIRACPLDSREYGNIYDQPLDKIMTFENLSPVLNSSGNCACSGNYNSLKLSNSLEVKK